jgi:hydroxymethylbilane synthase
MALRLGAATRGSALARWQTDHVAALLMAADPALRVEPVVVETVADRRLDIAIDAMGGKGVFVKEVQAAVLDGRADFAVHSAKDLPSVTPDGLVLVAVPARADPRDALVGARLVDLPHHARVATGSARRQSQLAWHRPDLRFTGLRGNIATRLAKAGDYDAIVMAKAALDRLGLAPAIVDVLEPSVVVPQVGQGALAVECRADDPATRARLAAIEHAPSRWAVDAERAFLAELGGDCTIPAGAHAVIERDDLRLTGVLASRDGRILLKEIRSGRDAVMLGRLVARHLLDDAGGAALLA